MSEPKTYVWVSYESTGRNEAEWTLHKPGCPDIARSIRKRGGHAYEITGESPWDAAEKELADINTDFIVEGSQGWSMDAVAILPCTKEAK